MFFLFLENNVWTCHVWPFCLYVCVEWWRWSRTFHDSIHHAITVCHSIVPLSIDVPLQIIFQDLVSVWIYLSIIQLHMTIHARVVAANTAQQFWTKKRNHYGHGACFLYSNFHATITCSPGFSIFLIKLVCGTYFSTSAPNSSIPWSF